MGKAFSNEIEQTPDTVHWAAAQDVTLLRRVIGAHSHRSMLSVGSGGSTTVAAFVAKLHETQFRKISRATTPVGLLTEPVAVADSVIALVSAEGKNPDIIAAARFALACERPTFGLSLVPSSPLGDILQEAGATIVAFDAYWRKDGYLATNSLLASLVLLARAYGIPSVAAQLSQCDGAWLQRRREQLLAQGIAQHVSPGRSLCLLHGHDGAIGALDLESKLTEAALGVCQVVDYRQFAHGRHLQLASPDRSPCVICYISKRDEALALASLQTFPAHVPVIRVSLPFEGVASEMVAVIDAMLITDILASARGIDPGQPAVPEFGRRLHQMDVSRYVPQSAVVGLPPAIRRKAASSNVRVEEIGSLVAAGEAFCQRLERARVRALVCDFDGTFCNTDLRYAGLDRSLIGEIERIAGAGIPIGFATGRGDSLHQDLRNKLAAPVWSKVTLGSYSGAVIASLDEPAAAPAPADLRLDSLVAWLDDVGLMHALGATAKVRGSQLSLSITNHFHKPRAVAYLRQWIGEHGDAGWRIYHSGHSIDVVTEAAGKVRVVQFLSQLTGCSAEEEVLRIGDSGDIEGNDYELLNGGLSLSVADVSMAKQTCWNLLPAGVKCAQGTLFYLRGLEISGGVARFRSDFIEHARQSIRM